ncbi:reverse transcriptase domain-containing protein [Tanacetum coccineum]
MLHSSTPGVSKSDFDHYVKANDAVMQNMQNQMANITDLITKFVNSNTASTSGSGSLPSNTIANPKGDVKAITTRSGVSYNGPQTSSPPKEKGKMNRGMNFLEEDSALIDCSHGEQMTLRHDDQSVTFKVGDTKTLSYNIIETVNRVDVIDIACEEYVQEVLETSESGNPTSTSDLTIDSRSPSFTPFGGSDFLMEEIDEFLERDDSIPPGVDGIYDSEGDTVYLEELLSVINSDPNLPPSPVCEINVPEKVKSSCEDPPDLELKDLPSHLDLEVADIKGINHCFAPIRFDGGNAKRRSTSERVTPKSMRHVPKVSLVAIFQRYDEKTLKSFMDDFSVFGTLSLFAFPLGQNASKGIEVDKAKDFSKIARPMTHLLEKETPFIFSKECIEAFETLKMKLTQAPILVAPDWDLPFEIMCDASDFAVGAGPSRAM